jgi:DivIVA domain-containing protein
VVDDVSKGVEGDKHPPAPAGREHGFGDLRHYVPRDILDVSFPVSVRGYDRQAVEAYIKRVNRVIAELKVSASPPAAVRHALDQAGEKVESLLQAAREAAEEITSSARQGAEEDTARAKAEAAELTVNTSAQADSVRAEAEEFRASARAEAQETVAKAQTDASEIVAKAKADASEIVARASAEADERRRQLQEELGAQRHSAETRMRELQSDTEVLWKERHELLDDVRTMASGLVDLANAAANRVSPPEPVEPGEPAEPEAEREADRDEVPERAASRPDT